jgi:serine/threonine protein kinase
LTDKSPLAHQRLSSKPETIANITSVINNPELLTGHVFGAYILKSPIGRGGSGIVYRAWNSTLGQNACVKVMYPLTDEALRIGATLTRSVRALAALNHRFLVKVFDLGRAQFADATSYYLAMELIDGPSLDSWHLLGKNRDASTLLQMGLDLATALDAAHNCRYIDETGFEQAGLLHGDIKPTNIIVRRDNSPVLLDFMMVDLQRLLDRKLIPHTNRTVECLTGLFGTPGFMAPEQERDGIVTVQSDLYSLGVTLSKTVFSSMMKPVAKPSDDKRATLPNLLLWMTQREPERRPQSAKEVVDSINNIAKSEEIQLVNRGSGATAERISPATGTPKQRSFWMRLLSRE